MRISDWSSDVCSSDLGMTANNGSRPVLVFDSGIGGLTVLREARVLMPERRFVYVADDAGFPYGGWEEGLLREHIVALFRNLIAEHDPEIAVIACRSEEHTSELQSLMRISYAVFCLNKKKIIKETKESI